MQRTEFFAWLLKAYRQPQQNYTQHNMEVAFAAGWQAARAQPANIQDGYSWALDLPGKPSIDGLHAVVSAQPADASEPAGAKVYAIDTIRTRADHLAKCAWQLLNACISIKIARKRYDDRKTATAAMELNAQEEVVAEYTHAVHMAIYEYHKRVQREIDLRFRQPAQPAADPVLDAGSIEALKFLMQARIENGRALHSDRLTLKLIEKFEAQQPAGEAVAWPIDQHSLLRTLKGARESLAYAIGRFKIEHENLTLAAIDNQIDLVKSAISTSAAPPAQVPDADPTLAHDMALLELIGKIDPDLDGSIDDVPAASRKLDALIATASPTQTTAFPDRPLVVFDKGPWILEPTGERFTGAQLDDAAFSEYLRLVAAPQPKGGE